MKQRTQQLRTTLMIVCAAVLAAACANTDFQPSSSAPKLPPYTGEVRVMQQFPYGEYVMLGTIFATGAVTVSEIKVRRSLLKQAAAQGANAVVLQGKLRTVESADGTEKKLAAWAIFIK
ncbi:MAG: hypothetical protein AAF458_08970 [Pseudomonadota bacterium]